MLEKLKPLVSERDFIFLSQIYQNAKTIHLDRILFPYTDHGIKHSDRILQDLMELFPELFEVNNTKKLSPTEVFCIASSIYLHDVGIQLYKDDSLRKYCNENKIDVVELSDKDLFVRKHHHALSKYWILDSVSRKPMHSISYVGEKDLAPFVANICESHGIDFELYDTYTDSESYNGESLRMGLLCTLLSLGDALDCDRRRITYEKLKNEDVPLDSRIHWMKHYYVNSVLVKKNYLKLFYHFPKCSNSADEAVYKYYFQRQTSYWIQKCKEIRGKFLLDANISYDIVQSVKFDNFKDILTDEEFKYVKLCAIRIIENEIYELNQLKQQLKSESI